MIILIVLGFLALSFIIGIFVNTKIKTIIDTTALNESAAYQSISTGLASVNDVGVQRGFILILALLIMFTIFSAFMVKQHPAFIFLNIVLLGVTIFVSVFVANSYAILEDNATLGPILEQQSMITYVMKHLTKILLAVGAINMIVLFSKLQNAPRGGDFGG
jgi:hypothetical protein